MRSVQSIQNDIKSIFNRLQNEFGNGYIYDLTGFKPKNLHDCLNKGDTDALKMSTALSSLNINYQTVIENIVDVDAIISRLKGINQIPQKYCISSFSKAFITKNILLNLKERCGSELVHEICHFIQLPYKDIQFIDDEIQLSTKINSDIYFYLKKYKRFQDKDLFRIGFNMTAIYKESDLFKPFQGMSSQEFFPSFIEELGVKLEKSFIYKLQEIDSEKVVVRRYLSDEILQSNEGQIYSNREACHFTQGFFSSMPNLIGLQAIEVEKTQCVFDNNSYTEYIAYHNVVKPHAFLQ